MEARPEVVAMIREYYALIDARRFEECERYLTPDSTLRIAHNPEVKGREAILAVMSAALRNVPAIRHNVGPVWEEEEGVAVFEVVATYSLPGPREVVVPGVVVAHISDGRFAAQRIYADLSTVFS